MGVEGRATATGHWSWGRVLAAGVPAIVAASIAGQVAAALVAWRIRAPLVPGAVALAILGVGGLGVMLGRARARTRVVAAGTGCAVAISGLVFMGLSPIASVAGVSPALASALLLPRLSARLPAELDGWLRRRPVVAAMWSLLAVLAVANTARLTIFMVDDSQVWASFFPPVPESAQHQCLAAYVRAGELAASDAENLYDASHYDVFANRSDPPQTAVTGMQPSLGDPFEYPPPFLIAPRAALAISNDFAALRAGWFALQALTLLAVIVLVAIWIGGPTGAIALLLVPALLVSSPLLLNWQWGQFHATAIALSMAGMVAFATRRTWLGGGLLAAGIGTKVFPGVLLIHLVAARGAETRTRLRPLFTTFVGGVVLVAVALLLVGFQPFRSFLEYQLPRIASGEAFAFSETNPDNYSPYGLVFKLRTLGVPAAGRAMAATVSWIYTLVVLVLAWASARRAADRATLAMVWLALLSLASLRSPFAPTYTGIAVLWLLSIWAGHRRPGVRSAVGLVVAWIILQGFPPVFSYTGNVIASLPGQLIAMIVPLRAVWPRKSPTPSATAHA